MSTRFLPSKERLSKPRLFFSRVSTATAWPVQEEEIAE